MEAFPVLWLEEVAAFVRDGGNRHRPQTRGLIQCRLSPAAVRGDCIILLCLVSGCGFVHEKAVRKGAPPLSRGRRGGGWGTPIAPSPSWLSRRTGGNRVLHERLLRLHSGCND